MNKSQLGGELLGQGSFGCVFKPALLCKSEKDTKSNNVSKVYFNKSGKKEIKKEYDSNKLIKKIKNYNIWAEIWFKKCTPPKYDIILKKEPEIEDCLLENNIDIDEFNKVRSMLQGNYGGITLSEYLNLLLKKKTFSNPSNFTNKFIDIMKSLETLFIGLKELHEHNIGHNDIKADNIVVDGGYCKYIDFGYSFKYSNNAYYKKRSSLEFLTDRIYPPYPYEFIYLYAPLDLLEDEKEDMDSEIYRSLHSRYKDVHSTIFKRDINMDLSSLIYRHIDGLKNNETIKPANRTKLLSLLDTYSLGMVIPHTLYSIAKHHKSEKKFLKLLKLPKIKPFMNLFKQMTETNYFNRINPVDLYAQYLGLMDLHVSDWEGKKKLKMA